MAAEGLTHGRTTPAMAAEGPMRFVQPGARENHAFLWRLRGPCAANRFEVDDLTKVHVQQLGLLGEGGVDDTHVPYTFVAKLAMHVFSYCMAFVMPSHVAVMVRACAQVLQCMRR